MRKPRCHNCEKSMKRIYERKGTKGVPSAITGWWFCSNCNKVELEPYVISDNPEDYLHPEAAKKFPEIARVFKFDANHYKLREQLLSMLDDTAPIRKYLESEKNKETFFFDKHRAMIRKLKHPKIQRRTASYPVWVCSKCEQSISLEEIGFEDGDIEEVEPPYHCSTPMKLGIISNTDGIYREREETLEAITEKIENGENNEAGFDFLNLILGFFEAFGLTSFQRDLRQISNFDWSSDPSFEKAMEETWGYKTVKCIFEAFQTNEPVSYLKPKNLIAKLFQITKIEPDEVSIEKLERVFDDIMLYLSNVSPQLIPDYRLKFNNIMAIQNNRVVYSKAKETGLGLIERVLLK